MQDQFNPYAAPTATTMHPRAAEWLRSTDDPSLQKVARGLGNIYTGIIVLIVAVILMVVGLLPAILTTAQGRQPAVGAAGGMVILAIVGGIAAIVGYIMMLIGFLRCLATPEETGAKGLITASVILAVLGFLVRLFGTAAEGETEGAMGTIGGLLSLGSQITFLLFLKRLSEFIGAIEQANRAKLLLILLGVTFVLGLVAGVSMLATPAVGIALLLALLVVGLVSFIMYVRLLGGLRQALLSGGAMP